MKKLKNTESAQLWAPGINFSGLQEPQVRNPQMLSSGLSNYSLATFRNQSDPTSPQALFELFMKLKFEHLLPSFLLIVKRPNINTEASLNLR